MSEQEHDSLVRAVFGRAEEAAAHLRAFLPAEILEALELETLKLVPRSFVTEEFRNKEVDLLFSVGAAERPGFVYILMEHQSSEQRFMALRLLSYLLEIWRWWRTDHAKATTIPIILPIVLHHGSKPWAAPRRLSELMAGSPELINRLRPILPELRYLVTDLAALPDEEILAKIINHSPLAALTAFFLKRGRDSALVEKIAVFAIPLRRLLTR